MYAELRLMKRRRTTQFNDMQVISEQSTVMFRSQSSFYSLKSIDLRVEVLQGSLLMSLSSASKLITFLAPTVVILFLN